MLIFIKPNRHVFFGVLVFCIISAVSSGAFAAFRFAGGSYGLIYKDFEKTEDGRTVQSASLMSQDLSLSAVNAGYFYNMRSSPYKILVGYRHERHSTDIDGRSYSPSTSDLNLAADLRLELKKMKDLNLLIIGNKGQSTPIGMTAVGQNIFNFPVSSEERRITSEYGISARYGYEKELRTFFSHYILSKGYSNDKEEREFSHASFQRGINWIHLDLEEVTIDSRNYRTELKKIRVGNVSHSTSTQSVPSTTRRGPREWFRLTNWLEISTDLDYTVKKTNNANEDTSNVVSFFGKGYRKIWSLFLSPTHRRNSNISSSGRSSSLPVRLNYYPSPAVEVSSNTNYSINDSKDSSGTTLAKTESWSESLKGILKPNQWLTLRPGYSVSRSTSIASSSLSNSVVFDSIADWEKIKASFLTTYDNSTSKSAGAETKSDSLSLKGEVTLYPDNWIRRIAISQSYSKSTDNSGSSAEFTASEMHFLTEPLPRLNFDVLARLNESKNNSVKTTNEDIRSKLRYRAARGLKNDTTVNYSRRGSLAGENKKIYIENMTLYKIGKSISSNTSISSDKDTGYSGNSEIIRFSEAILYSVYGGGWFKRKIYDIGLSYDLNSYDDGRRETSQSSYTLSIDYYLSRIYTMGAGYEYSYSDSSDVKDNGINLYVSMRYPKLQAGLTYERDTREGSSFGEQVDERITFTLKKFFY